MSKPSTAIPSSVTNFFNVFTPGQQNYRDINYLMSNVFSGNPTVGIANNAGPEGPSFTGATQVSDLFNQLCGPGNAAFPQLSYTPVLPYCSNGNTLIVQATLDTGPQTGDWFSKTSPYYSRPLSDIKHHGAQTTIPTCAVFTLDSGGLIQGLGIYMDRWQMALDLWDQSRPPHLA